MGRRKRKLFVQGGYIDYQSVFLILVLLMFGIVMVYSASSYRAVMNGLPSTYYVKRQAVFAAIGFLVMLFVSHINYRIYAKYTNIMVIISIIMMAAVMLMGVSANGSARWLAIGSIQFQPSEIAKVAIIIYMAHSCVQNKELLTTIKGILIMVIVPMICIVMIAIENLSTAVICFAVVGVMLFVASPKIGNIALLALVGVLLLYIGITAVGYRGDRLEAWRDPMTSPNGFQTKQSLYAIGSGGLFGRGLGNSMQKMGFLPESHNDMIFSIICEELGIFGATGVIVLFIMLLLSFKKIADNAPDSFGGFLVTGVITHIAVQALVNIGVVTNIIPNTGVTLPLISYGGTSLIILMAEIGIVLSVSRQSAFGTEPLRDGRR